MTIYEYKFRAGQYSGIMKIAGVSDARLIERRIDSGQYTLLQRDGLIDVQAVINDVTTSVGYARGKRLKRSYPAQVARTSTAPIKSNRH